MLAFCVHLTSFSLTILAVLMHIEWYFPRVWIFFCFFFNFQDLLFKYVNTILYIYNCPRGSILDTFGQLKPMKFSVLNHII